MEEWFDWVQQGILILIGSIVCYLFFQLSIRIPKAFDVFVQNIPEITQMIKEMKNFFRTEFKEDIIMLKEDITIFKEEHQKKREMLLGLSNEQSLVKKNCIDIMSRMERVEEGIQVVNHKIDLLQNLIVERCRVSDTRSKNDCL